MLGEYKEVEIIDKNKNYYIASLQGENHDILISRQDGEFLLNEKIRVFIYDYIKNSYYGSKAEALIKLGEVKSLKVLSVTNSGIFIDWGLRNDLFMPYANAKTKLEEGKEYLFSLQVNKNRRLVGSMNIKNLLANDSNYTTNDWVEGRVYSTSPDYGAFVAVDDKYDSLINKDDLTEKLFIGDKIRARVISKNKDGKLNLSLRNKAHELIDEDARKILFELEKNKGYLGYGDKSDPDMIRKTFNMSKSSFKKALGKLYKLEYIVVGPEHIKRTNKEYEFNLGG